MTDERCSCFCIVTGRVQGVGLRAFCQAQAKTLSLVGSAKNLANGTVQLQLVGPRPALELFLDWLRAAPGFSRIENVDVVWGEWYDGGDNFLIG